MIDLHTHVLPGIDDGARTMGDALAMCRSALEDGVQVMAATPHVRDDFPTSPGAMEQALAALRRELDDAGLAIQVLPGAEIALDRLPRLSPDELARFGLGGNPHVLLLEFPYYGFPLGLARYVAELAAQGITPVLAHPERNPDVQVKPELLRESVLGGALVQVTAASLDGRLGKRPRAIGLALVEAGLAHLIASDGHMPDLRGIGMSAAANAVADSPLAHWLTSEVPKALVLGEAPPPRPSSSSRPRRLRAFRG